MRPIVKQGDAYYIPIDLRMDDEIIETERIDTIEVYFGKQRHLYPTGDLLYTDGSILVPLSQESTLSLRVGILLVDVRVKFTDGTVLGIPEKLKASISDAVSTEVL